MAFDQNQDLVLGEALMLYVTKGASFLPIAYATSHTLTINGDTIDTSSKMSGNWQDFLVGQLNWQLTSESLISKTSGHMSFDDLMALMVARQGIPIKIGTPTANSDTFELDNTKPTYNGTVVITSLEQTANRGEVCTSSCTLQGKGALTKTPQTT